ncbi:hypothetical protein BCR44DRAFT_1024912 [Catenaria anguillulae PL171]|uniref:DUF6604 domain-containing protein n=1 Tax=Catenaria anguillulae PL171 TaxID=765915 RepID=A0A1Y2HT44_9FUNG|nr:hypothetical protein BCR44DRAFT_1024912 [Catenaria anguillulae PL171]
MRGTWVADPTLQWHLGSILFCGGASKHSHLPRCRYNASRACYGLEMNESAATSAPKLSPDLFGLYKQYKRDTSCLATWLVNTSHSLGYSAALPDDAASPSSPQPASAKAPRLKGKARKDAQKNRPERAPSSSSPHSSSSTCKDKSHGSTDIPTTSINGNQFVNFAQFIANTEPAITVPTRVLDWACRAIRGRQVCGDWFRDRTGSESSEDDTLAKSNRAHDHFTALLEQVVVILAPRVASAKAAMRSPQSTPLTGVELLESRFAALDMDAQQTAPGGDAMSEDEGDDWDVVYGLVQETLASKSHGADKRGKDKRARIPVSFGNGRVRYRVEDEEAKEWDLILELSNHLHDALEIVAFIKEHWVKYFDQSHMSLEAASITTLVGLDRLRDLHNKMMELFPALMPHHLKYGRIVTLCVRVKLHGFEPETVSPAYFTSEASKEQNESKKFSYLDMVDVIEPLRAAIHRGHVERPPPVTQAPSCAAPFPYTDSLDGIVAAFRTVLTRLYLDYRALEAQPAFCHFGYTHLPTIPVILIDFFLLTVGDDVGPDTLPVFRITSWTLSKLSKPFRPRIHFLSTHSSRCSST